MKLFAISDVHLRHPENREAPRALPACPDDWLILGGDIGETLEHLEFALRTLGPRFKKLVWVPGNHDLWSLPGDVGPSRGEARYQELVALCRQHGVLTPEDPYPLWPGDGGPCVIARLFLLYDYSFRPPGIPASQALEWAMEAGVLCADEALLHPDPYPSRQAWCAARCEWTAARLEQIGKEQQTVLINHFPLREDLVRLRWIPRFSLWCGTQRTADWHLRFRARVVVSGHLHMPATDWRDGVRFEEVSMGYPSQWMGRRRMESLLREILPGPA